MKRPCDGKAIRKTYKANYQEEALQIVTAYCTETGLVLGQEMITSEDKTNEIPIVQKMINYMNIKGRIITIDALHTQKSTCELIYKNKGYYIIGLKANNKKFYNEVVNFFADENNKNLIKSKTITEVNKGRTETRTCYKTTDLSNFSYANEWAGLKTIFAIKRVVTNKKETTTEISYYISSCKSSAEVFLKNTRAHWKVESMHWMLDVVFNEDDSVFHSENSYHTLNIFRKLSLLLHKKYVASLSKKISIKGNMLNCLLTDALIIDVLAL